MENKYLIEILKQDYAEDVEWVEVLKTVRKFVAGEILIALQEEIDEYKYTNTDGMYPNLVCFIDRVYNDT